MADFHSKMSVCRHELGSPPPTIPTMRVHVAEDDHHLVIRKSGRQWRDFNTSTPTMAYWYTLAGTLNLVPVFTARCTLVQSAVLRSHVVCLSVPLSVTLVDCDHIGWNSSKLISSLVSLGCSLFATPT